MPGRAKTIKHITAAEITANLAKWHTAMQKMARGTDATARRTGRSWKGMGKHFDAFERAADRSAMRYVKRVRQMRQVTERDTAAMRRAWGLTAVNMSRGPMSRAMQTRRGMPMMARGGGAGSMLRGAAGFLGPWALWNQMEKSKGFSERITDVQIKAGKGADWGKGLERQILKVSDATGKSKDEVLDYVQQFTELTGKADQARKALKTMSSVAVASNAPMRDLAGVTDQLTGSLGITDPAALKRTMGVILQHERLGKVPFAALAGQFGKVSSRGQLFGKAGQGFEAARSMSALFQLTARGFGAGQEGMVATSAGRFLSYMAKNRKKVEKRFGITLGTGQGKNFMWKSLSDVFKTIGAAAAKRPDLLAKYGQQLFGERGVRSVMELAAAHRQGWGTTVGTRTSAAAMFGATGAGVIEKSIADRKQSQAYKWNLAMARMSNTLHRHMLPVLEKATEVMPHLAKALKFVLENSGKIIRLWIGYKGAQFFAALATRGRGRGMGMGMGTGGGGGSIMAGGMGAGAMGGGYVTAGGVIPGSDLDILRRQQYDRIARRRMLYARMRGVGGMTAAIGGEALGLPTMVGGQGVSMASTAMLMSGNPYAMALGGGMKLGQFGGAVGSSVSEFALGHNFRMMTMELQRVVNAIQGASQLATADTATWYETTIAGDKAKRGALTALRSLGAGDKEGFDFDPAKLKKLGKGGMMKSLGQLKTSYSAIYGHTAAAITKEGGKATQEAVFEARPELQMMYLVMKELEKTIVGLRKGIKVTAIANITSSPGDRANSREPETPYDDPEIWGR